MSWPIPNDEAIRRIRERDGHAALDPDTDEALVLLLKEGLAEARLGVQGLEFRLIHPIGIEDNQ